MTIFKYGEEECGEAQPDTCPVMPPISDQTEASRVSRLIATYGRACAAVALQSNRYRRLFDGAIVEIGDTKGTLNIVWRDQDSRAMFEGVMMGAWEAEGEHMGRHDLAG